MKEPRWVAYDVVLAIHEAQLAEHGGSPGIRDQGLLDSALAHPKNLYACSENATLAQLATSYAIGLAKTTPLLMAISELPGLFVPYFSS